jgi:hypothetical protein
MASQHEHFMAMAIEEAKAAASGEQPFETVSS